MARRPAFLYGWSLLLVIQSGGMAAVAITFARYFRELTELALPDGAIAVAVLALLMAINCLGVRAGGTCRAH
jgi:APA family basic amino acid/polyamine antiporter